MQANSMLKLRFVFHFFFYWYDLLIVFCIGYEDVHASGRC